MTTPHYKIPPLTPHEPNSWTPTDLFQEGDFGTIMASMMVELRYKNGKLDSAVLISGSKENDTVLRPETGKPTP